MLKNKVSFKSIARKLRNRSVDFDIEPYKIWLQKINEFRLESLSDSQLRDMSLELIRQARNGLSENELLIPAFALVREAARRILGMKHFDVQVIAGIAMHDGNLVEMQTGEGKTLTAVLPVYLNAISGRGVHVLTFNDYLAQRDAEWMGPLYGFLGLSIGHVREGMSLSERRRAYEKDITYLTAKEAGFDYLKEFLCTDRKELVLRPFNFGVIDEADSILIDEARIPLVIAGKTDNYIEPGHMTEIIRSLEAHADYEVGEYERTVYLTDRGLNLVETILGAGNLYDEKNLKLLVDINNALHAEVLLKRDVDYIVRNGRIELVDEFTGRVADKRHWPYGLQEAIEAKEGIISDTKGQILSSITLQNFIRLYPKICGMTGTAATSANEFQQFYGLNVLVIPTNKPCIREDLEDVIFTHKEAKLKAITSEIVRVHSTGRPILVGTCSVEESEQLAGALRESGVVCQVLNAKNDELEAGIIAQAGAIGAVTVSTNMAGRGTDIKLGGAWELNREEVVRLGGLYVIGTNRYESRRIDDQLRGRAGRQGDPGSTRFFISLEDDLFKRYRFKELIPASLYPENQENPIENKIIKKRVGNVQRIIEGQNTDIRLTLSKYSSIMEKQRQSVYEWRQGVLCDRVYTGLMPDLLQERYQLLLERVGEQPLRKAEKQVTLFYINKCWADYLDYMSYIRESIHLVNVAGKTPVHEFNKISVESFRNFQQDIVNEIAGKLAVAEITEDGVDMDKEGLKAPTSTWTYLINDSPEQVGINPALNVSAADIFTVGIWMLAAIGWKLFRKEVKQKN
ncbi:MAG: accessory Sec system translocase SecA2 [Clostridia bacterium]|nr:accessory Sec system translocase SecA2 [Clostridia bacterium]